MQRKIAIATLTLGILLQAGLCMAYDDDTARKLFEKKCTQCHGIQDYNMSNRSLKEWQLTVERMADYGVEKPYTPEEIDDIVTFLYRGKHESPPTEKPAVATQPTTSSVTASIVPRPKRQVSWQKPRSLGVAKFMGYLAVALMAGMVASGLVRKRIRRSFHGIHVVMAIGLFGALSIHVSVYLCEYGVQNVLWLWFGILASILVAVVEFGGLLRAKLGGSFVRIHSICGCVGLLLVLLHWFWIYI
ncbi:MAG: cytochrome c [bacterium]|nr:cytochrome c [bacterium]